ncbi:hypothetical protein [Cellulophaga baltica]|nr:hypothetical protein [Cellulophaga baltica]
MDLPLLKDEIILLDLKRLLLLYALLKATATKKHSVKRYDH